MNDLSRFINQFSRFELIILTLFVLLVGGVLIYAQKNMTSQNQFKEILSKFKNRILLEGALFISLLLLRSFLSFNVTRLQEFRWLDKSLIILILILLYRLLSLLLDVINYAYSRSNLSLRRPLTPVFQALKIILLIIVLFGVLAVVLDKDPLLVMGSVSTIVAFVSFIFQDILLGFFAGIQLTSTDTIRIGDFISVPELDISGSVETIGLTMVTLVAFDQTHTTVAATNLIKNPIINYRHLALTQGRQFVRRFNFNPVNANKISVVVEEVRHYLMNHPEVDENNIVSVQIQEGTLNNLILSVSVFSKHPDYQGFDLFASRLSASIVEILASHNLFS